MGRRQHLYGEKAARIWGECSTCMGRRQRKENLEYWSFVTSLPRAWGTFTFSYRGTSLIRNCLLLGPYSRTVTRALRSSSGGRQILMSEVPLYQKCQNRRILRAVCKELGRRNNRKSGDRLREATLRRRGDIGGWERWARGRSHKTTRCRGVTYPESYITKYTTYTKTKSTFLYQKRTPLNPKRQSKQSTWGRGGGG